MIESTYAKLFQCILTSSVWQEDDATRLVWITLLALKNRWGEVSGSIPGIAHAAKVPLPEAERAIQKLLAPDQYSRSKEHEGRRIEEIPGGWRILNHEKYRQAMNEDERRAYKARWAQKNRADKKAASGQSVDKSGCLWTHTDTDADTSTEPRPKKPRTKAQKDAWTKINHHWDHGKLDGDIYRFRDNEPTREQQEYLDSLDK